MSKEATRQDTRHRTHILNRHWRNGDRRWRRTTLRSPFLTRNIGELPVSRSSFPLLLEDRDEITVWILWLDLLFSTVCAKGRLDQIERGSVTTGGAVGRKQFVCGNACGPETQIQRSRSTAGGSGSAVFRTFCTRRTSGERYRK
jgi:hypothetical protein